ncbi:MAG: hydrogenase expression/formation protein HypE [Gracilibacteraceae bacterium]|nr:hydrogenase expression/formation protein HypE [Gracilibacteraceae bacterium]
MVKNDRITLAHGSGGSATRDLIADLFASCFANPFLDRLEDAALLARPEGGVALTTDSYVITPLVFPGGDIGKLAVCGTVNDLWMMGAEPRFLTAGFIIEEGLDYAILDSVVKSMAREAAAQNVLVVTGDTKVVGALGSSGGQAAAGQTATGGLFINTCGLGSRVFQGVSAEKALGREHLREGDAVLVSGVLGNHHACILSRRLGIENGIASDCAGLGGMVRALLREGVRVKLMRDITRGGLATVLNEIVRDDLGIRLEEREIPVDGEVEAFCGLLGLDPLYMANEGKFVCVVENRDVTRALAILRQNELGTRAAVVGHVTARNQGEPGVLLTTRLGGIRVIDVLYGEGLPRIC